MEIKLTSKSICTKLMYLPNKQFPNLVFSSMSETPFSTAFSMVSLRSLYLSPFCFLSRSICINMPPSRLVGSILKKFRPSQRASHFGKKNCGWTSRLVYSLAGMKMNRNERHLQKTYLQKSLKNVRIANDLCKLTPFRFVLERVHIDREDKLGNRNLI